MADPELASKLAKRLESVDDAAANSFKAKTPPPAPKIPEKVVPNPYVAADNSVSIDDLIAKAMERKEQLEENNNVATPGNITMNEEHVVTTTMLNGTDTQPDTQSGLPPKLTLADLLAKDQRPASLPHAASPSKVPVKQPPAPKTTIGELLVRDKQLLSPPPTSKCPIVPVQHHVPKPEVKRRSPEEDGSELERKLAAQRAKKSLAAAAAEETNVIFSSPEGSTTSASKLEGPEKPVPSDEIRKLNRCEGLEYSPVDSRKNQVSESVPKQLKAEEGPKKETEQQIFETKSTEGSVTQPIAIPSQSEPSEELRPPPLPSSEPPKLGPSNDAPTNQNVIASSQLEPFKELPLLPPPPSGPSNCGLPKEVPAAQGISSSSQLEPFKEPPLLPPPPSKPPPSVPVVPDTATPSHSKPMKEPPPPPLPTSEPPKLGPLNEADLKNLLSEEVKKCKITKEEMIVIKDMEARKDAARPFSPTKELLELIHHENGIRSPPPIPPPKPQTPSHSRPESPVVKVPEVVDSNDWVTAVPSPCSGHEKEKLTMPSVTPTTELKMFIERQNKSSQMQKSLSQDTGDELSALLERRTKILQGESVPEMINKKLSLYAEFSEFSRKQIKFFTETFRKYDEDADGFIDFDELKRMMEKLGEAQTHIALKEIIRQVDEDKDGKISLREFFLIFRLAAQNQLGCSQVFQLLADSVDVSKEGVLGAASFFQAKIEEQTKVSRFEQEMKEEQEERKRIEEEKKARREKFLQNKSIFQ